VADHGTAIEWTQAPGYKGETWNPVTGCDRVSPGCAHCYALDLAAKLKRWGQPRYQRDGDPKTSGPGFGLTLHEDKLKEPLRWTKPRMVFVNSMSDLFHEEIPDEFIRRVFHTMAESPQHVYQVLTKRPERMRDLLQEWATPIDTAGCCDGCVVCWHDYSADFPLPNVWLGVTIENRRFVHRADLLRQTPAAVRFISAEPLLGPLVFDSDTDGDGHPATMGPCWSDGAGLPDLDLRDIDWLIAGGESGPNHRAVKVEWVRALREQCVHQRYDQDGLNLDLPGTRFFFKQWGGTTAKAGGRDLDGRTWSEWPQALEAAVST
jgi:protein gp37